MANYQPTHNLNPNRPGVNKSETQSTGAPHSAQHVQGVMDNITAQPLPSQCLAANKAEEAAGFQPKTQLQLPAPGHGRVNFKSTHTCATCKEVAPNNYALERHAYKERHKAFLCTCTTKFVRLATLDRHIADQAGPKHHCDYCDDDKGFARSDKLIDHLRTGHKFGEKAIDRIRAQIGALPRNGGHGLPANTAADLSLPASTSVAHYAAPVAATTSQDGFSKVPFTGSSDVPAGISNDGVTDFNAVDFQPFGIDGHYLLPSASGELIDFDVSDVGFPGDGFANFNVSGADFSGVDFSDFDLDMEMYGVDNRL